MTEPGVPPRWQAPPRADLIVLAVALVTWSAGLVLGFFLDDLHNLESALAAPLTLEGLTRAFSVFDPATIDVWCLTSGAVHFFRPLFVLSLKLDHAVWGDLALGYHLTNLALHALNSWLVLRVLARVGLAPRLALLGACLFAAFPHHTVAVLWISGRTELLLATFVLASLLLYARSFEAAHPWRLRLGALGMAACAFLTKEGAVVLPAYLALVDWLLRDRRTSTRAALTGMARRLGPVAALTAVYLVGRLGLMGLGPTPPKPYYIPPGDPDFAVFLLIKTVYYYVSWLTSLPILPVAPIALLAQHPAALAGVVLLTVAGWGAVLHALRGWSDRWTWLAWTLVGLVPTASVMASNHYTYLSNVGVAVLAAAVYARIVRIRWRRVVVAAAVVVVAAHVAQGVGTYYQMTRDNQRLVAAVTEAAPGILAGDADLYLVNVPFIGAHTGQELRLLHGSKGLRTHLVTVSSEPFAVGPAPAATWHGRDALSLTLPAGWIDADLVRMFLLTTGGIVPDRTYASGPARLIPRAGADGKVASLELTWPAGDDPARRYVVLFRTGPDGGVTAERLAN